MAKITITFPEDIFRKNLEAYEFVDLTEAYMLLCMKSIPKPELYKSIDTALVRSNNKLIEQIEADGIAHTRIKIGDSKGKMRDVLDDEYEFKRISGFYLILRRTVRGDVSTTDIDVLHQYGFSSREELIHTLPELYNEKLQLKVGRHNEARLLLKELIAEYKNIQK